MSVNGKVKTKKSTVSGRPPSYEFSIVRNQRDPHTKTPTPVTIKYLGTLTPATYRDSIRCSAFIGRLKCSVLQLIWDEIISVAEGKKVMTRFGNTLIDGISFKSRCPLYDEESR